jgi:hypothetical protein
MDKTAFKAAIQARIDRHKTALHALRQAELEASKDGDLTWQYFDERQIDILAGLQVLKSSLSLVA